MIALTKRRATTRENITDRVKMYAPHSKWADEPPGKDLITTIIRARAKTGH